MKLGYVSALFVGAFFLVSGARAAGTPPTLAQNMQQIGTIFRALKVATPNQNAQSANQAKQMAALFTAVLSQVPTVISSMPAAQQPAAVSDYQSLIQQEIDLSNQLAQDYLANHNADAAKALTDMGNLKTEGHGKYNP